MSVEVRPSSIHGKGLFATKRLRKGAFVAEYVGPIIPYDPKSRNRYLFEVSPTEVIDGHDKSNIARYINHTKRPNCEARGYARRIRIYTSRVVARNAELTLDYGLDYTHWMFTSVNLASR